MPLPEEPEEKPVLQVGGAQAVLPTTSCTDTIHRTGSSPPDALRGERTVAGLLQREPLSYSFAEAGQQKQLLMIDLEPGKAAVVQEIPLTRSKPLLRKKAKGVEEHYSGSARTGMRWWN